MEGEEWKNSRIYISTILQLIITFAGNWNDSQLLSCLKLIVVTTKLLMARVLTVRDMVVRVLMGRALVITLMVARLYLKDLQ